MNAKKLEKIDRRMKEIKLPPGYGTLPSAISSAFHSMKSDEYKTWVLFVSLFALRDVIPKHHFNMWQVFVRACKLLLKPYITNEEVNTAHDLLKLFNITYERIVGKEFCTPNMHMQLHIRQCILDFGPVYAFWCYSFERYNGILGQYQTNNKSITVQLMKRFLEYHYVITSYSNLNCSNEDIPSLGQLGLLSKKNECLANFASFYRFRVSMQLDKSLLIGTKCSFMSNAKLQCLSKEEVQVLTMLLNNLLPNATVEVNHIVSKYQRIQIGRSIIACSQYREKDNKNQFVMILDEGEQRPGFVSNIISVAVTIDNETHYIPFVEVKVFQKHPYYDFYGVNCPMKIWGTSVDSEFFVPAIAIFSKCVVVKAENLFERIPLAENRVSRVKTLDIVNFIFEIL